MEVINTNTILNIKANVYLCINKDDHDILFNQMADFISNKVDCKLYYSYVNEVYSSAIEAEIDQMNLIIVAITQRFIDDSDGFSGKILKYVINKGIPRLLLAQEPYLEEAFNKTFGNYQILSNFVDDPTLFSYEKKINKTLRTHILNDQTSKRIFEVFPSFIFLSYRKTDRNYTNKLMKELHKNQKDLGIWYDEFLTCEEDFNKEIEKAIDDCNAFVMVVTPRITEPSNYILKDEYPFAKKKKKAIIPIEMEYTNKADLDVYENLPPKISFKKAYRALSEVLNNKHSDYKNDPEKLYLLGTAYLYGIYTEVNRERAVNLLKKSAELGYPDAIEKLIMLPDFKEEREKLLKRLDNIYSKSGKIESQINALFELSYDYTLENEIQMAIKEYKKIIKLSKKIKSDEYLFYANKDLANIYKRSKKYFYAVLNCEKANKRLKKIHTNHVVDDTLETADLFLLKSDLCIRNPLILFLTTYYLKKAESICEKCNQYDPSIQMRICKIYENYGLFYKRRLTMGIKRFEKAAYYHKKSINILEKYYETNKGYSERLALAYYNNANNYLYWGERACSTQLINKAFRYFEKSKELFLIKKNRDDIIKIIDETVQKAKRRNL